MHSLALSEALCASVCYYIQLARQLFDIFSCSSTSVTPVTQNHFYTINAAKDNGISHNTMQNFVNLAISGSRISEPREINNDVEGSDFDIVSLSFIRHGLMFANTNVGSRMLYNIHGV